MASAVEIGVELMNKQGKEYRAEIARLTKERDELLKALGKMLDAERRAYGAEGKARFDKNYAAELRLIANAEQS